MSVLLRWSVVARACSSSCLRESFVPLSVKQELVVTDYVIWHRTGSCLCMTDRSCRKSNLSVSRFATCRGRFFPRTSHRAAIQTGRRQPTHQRTNQPTNQRTNGPTDQRTNEPTMGCCVSCFKSGGEQVASTEMTASANANPDGGKSMKISRKMTAPTISVEENRTVTGTGLAMAGVAIEQDAAYWEWHVQLPEGSSQKIMFGVATRKDRAFYKAQNESDGELWVSSLVHCRYRARGCREASSTTI